MNSLSSIYGQDSTTLVLQERRYTRVRDAFLEHFGPGPVEFFRTPGRINLIGEHTDYNGGFVMPLALDKDVLFGVRPRKDSCVRMVNLETEFPSRSFELSDRIPPAVQGDWSNYFRGAGQALWRLFGQDEPLKGMDVLVSGSLPHGVPRGSGLSSSTALTVNAAFALVQLNDLEINRADLAHLCSEAEWYVGTRGGMMDQFSALLGKRDYALFLDCRPSPEGKYVLEHVPIPEGVQILLLNSGVRHDNVRGEFNLRVAECKIGVALLQRHHDAISQLRDVTSQVLGISESALWTVLKETLPVRCTVSDLLARGLSKDWLEDLMADHRLPADTLFAVLPRCRHVITENARVLAGVSALRAGQVEIFGRLMDKAHVSMSRDYAASCPQVDTLVEIANRQPGVLGARITGAGWGGGVVALIESGSAEKWLDELQTRYRKATGLACEVLLCRPGDGAGQVFFT